MNLKSFLVLPLAIGLLVCSCKGDDAVSSLSEGKDVYVTLTLDVEDASAATRSANAVLHLGGESPMTEQLMPVSSRSTNPYAMNENTVRNLCVLQYINGTLVRKEFISSLSGPSFQMPLRANTASEKSNIYIMANVATDAFALPPFSEADFSAMALSSVTESGFFPVSGYLPMSACTEGVSISSSTSSLPIKLSRMLARIDVPYNIASTLFSSYTGFKIRLCNVPDKAYYQSPAAGVALPYPSAPTLWNTEYELLSSASGMVTFYVPDNRRGTGGNTSGTDEKLKTGVSDATYVEIVAEKSTETVTYKIYPGADTYNDYNICRNNQYQLSLAINGTNDTDARVEKVVQVATSNCYMVVPGTSVKIPVKRANESDLGMQLADLTTGWTAEVIWRDNSSMTLTLSEALKSEGMFEVSTNSGQEGNALVCIKDGSNNILWSWHIWVTGYDPAVTNHSYNSLIWMDRNLGADNATPGSVDALGYLYQWGRKDPFAGASSSAENTNTFRTLYSGASGSTTYSVPAPITAPVTSANNLQNSVRNPSLFYFKADGTNDWYPGSATTTQNDALWGATKTVYDPCPQGWKIPANGAWPATLTTSTSTWSTTNLGLTITASSAWYPANGFRYFNAGALGSVGAYGFYWSSTVDSTTAYNLLFLSSNVYPSVSSYRATGCGVRCVQE